MKPFQQICVLAALFAFGSSPVLADALFTNAVSAVVSYQYPEDVSGEALTNGVISPVVSYQYPDDFGTAALTNSAVISPVVSYQYYEWPGDDILHLLYSPYVSYFYQSGNNPTSLVVRGTVTDLAGTGILGATVTASVQQSVVAITTTDSGGHYALPALGSGAYILTASEASHAPCVRPLTLSSATAVKNFRLGALLTAPSVQQTNRQPSPAFTQPPAGPMGSNLKVFDGTNFVNITAENAPSTNLMTIVMTHGWVKTNVFDAAINDTAYNLWPADMAAQLRANGIAANNANIVIWDWRYAAEDMGLFRLLPAFAAERTPAQGVALGKALLDVLKSKYSQPIHFIGHSLGTIVNAAAINYLHGECTGTPRSEVLSPTPWALNAVPVHITLFDQALVAEDFGNLILSLNSAISSTQEKMGTPLPVRFTWADNYVSFVAAPLPQVVNVWLQKAADYDPGVEAQHGYPVKWYGLTIADPTNVKNPLGFQMSFEYGGPSVLPPTDFPAGVTYHYRQKPLASDQLALEPLPSWAAAAYGGSILPLGIIGGVKTTVIQATGNVFASVNTSAQRMGQDISQWFNSITQQDHILNSLGGVQGLFLMLSSPATAPIQLSQGNAVRMLDVSGSVSTNTSAMAWIPLLIPSNSIAMAFDFSLSGDPMDDVLVCGIDTNALFSLEAKYIPTNYVSSSRFLDVSAWAGTTNELFFGLMGGTSTNATLRIDNIRFYSFQPPIADFVAAPTGDPAALTVEFADMSSGTITNWHWDFGDGTATNMVGTGIAHTYAAPGTNEVILTVSGPTGSGTNTQSVSVIVWNAYQMWSMHYFGSITNILSEPDTDPDGDGMNNEKEYESGTDPLNVVSLLRITDVGQRTPVNTQSYLPLVFQSVNNKAYVIQVAPTVTGTWMTVSEPFVAVSNRTQVLVRILDSMPQAFYRVRTSVPLVPYTFTLGFSLPDQWIGQYNWNSLSPEARNLRNAADDPDGDGMDNQSEMVAGTDPTDPTSCLRMLSFRADGDVLSGDIQTTTGRVYYVESLRPGETSWHPVTGYIGGQNGATPWQVPRPSESQSGFFRAILGVPSEMTIITP